jgi:hypothetical protein
MALIEVKYDPTLEQSDIIARIDNTSLEEAGENYEGNMTAMQQTSIYGVQCPIIAVNNIMVAMEDILSFELDDSKHIPKVTMHIIDRKSLIQYLDAPGNDNELRVQILPPFEDAYKKINLTFLVSNFSMGEMGNDLYITGVYKLAKFTDSQFKSFGEVCLYDLFDKIASETQLGFATNVEAGEDKRYVYCPYNSYQNVIEKEIKHSGDETTVYDWWIDVWNYLNLANMYERYTAIDQEDDMKVWISGAVDEVGEGIHIEPQEVPAELTNLFGSEESQLFVGAYRLVTKPGINVREGTDKIYSVYSMNNKAYEDTYISDGDVKKDVFNNFEYKGEVYGDYDYITGGMKREPFFQKMNNGCVEVDLQQPLLGIQRGNHVTFACYYNDDNRDYPTSGLPEEGGMEEDPQTTTPVMEPDTTGADTFKLDKSISGQYMVAGNKYKFANNQWTHTVILTRPIDQKPKILAEEE